jgi:hypothetical protein
VMAWWKESATEFQRRLRSSPTTKDVQHSRYDYHEYGYSKNIESDLDLRRAVR